MTTLDSGEKAYFLCEAKEMTGLVQDLTRRVTQDVRAKIAGAINPHPQVAEDLEVSLSDIQDALIKLDPLKAALSPDKPDEALRKVGHDINNWLSVVIASVEFIEDDLVNMEDGHHHQLDRLEQELHRSSDTVRFKLIQDIGFKLSHLFRDISQALQGEKRWEDIVVTPNSQEQGELMPLNGKSFLIIDDDAAIARIAGKKLVQAGGTYEYFNGQDELPADLGFEVILLDHRLVGHNRGYDLLASLNGSYQSAKIIVHSADAHNAKEMAHYGDLPQIAKFDWTELNKHL